MKARGKQWSLGGFGVGAGRDSHRFAVYVVGVIGLLVTILGACWYSFGRGDTFPLNAGSKRPYIEAMVLSARTGVGGTKATAETRRCVAAALVHGYGVSTFAKAGLTPNVLRSRKTTLNALPRPSVRQIDEIGTAEQMCGLGPVLATALGKSLNIRTPGVLRCIGRGLDHHEDARRYVVLASLGRKPDAMAAQHVVMVAMPCVRLDRLALDTSGLALTASEKSCITAAARPNRVKVNMLLATSIMGKKPSGIAYEQVFRAGIDHCVSAHRRAHLSGK